MNHIDLFTGIGGFSLAADWVWGDEHEIVSFVEIDPFCQKVLKKHWPGVPIHDDIKTFTYADRDRLQEPGAEQQASGDRQLSENKPVDLITGGFPCQSFSTAGKRKGRGDNRYLWPEMFRVIQMVNPRWVIAENVPGLISIENGMVFEQVCSDLESENYQVQAFIIPACSVNAPHRRDRIWIVAHSKSIRSKRRPEEVCEKNGGQDGGLHPKSYDTDRNVTHSIGGEYRTGGEQIREEDGLPGINRETLCSGGIIGTDRNAENSNSSRKSQSRIQQADIPPESDSYAPDTSSLGLCGGGKNGSNQQSALSWKNIQQDKYASNPDRLNDDDAGHGSGEISQFKEAEIFRGESTPDSESNRRDSQTQPEMGGEEMERGRGRGLVDCNKDASDPFNQGLLGGSSRGNTDRDRIQESEQAGSESWGATSRCNEDVADTSCTHGTSWRGKPESITEKIRNRETTRSGYGHKDSWGEPWFEVATRLCGVDARIPNRVDRLKSLGNSIVPQVVYQIMMAIKEVDSQMELF